MSLIDWWAGRLLPAPAPEGYHWETALPRYSDRKRAVTLYLVEDGQHVNEVGMYDPPWKRAGNVIPWPSPWNFASVDSPRLTRRETQKLVDRMAEEQARRARVRMLREEHG